MKERKKVLLWLLIVAVLLVASIITGNHAGTVRDHCSRPCGMRCSTTRTGSICWAGRR
ncbi:MAG: hypothetical protein V8S34_00185 [Lawsonibacter sp.]